MTAPSFPAWSPCLAPNPEPPFTPILHLLSTTRFDPKGCCWEEARPGDRPARRCDEPVADGKPWYSHHLARWKVGQMRRGRLAEARVHATLSPA